MAPSSENNPATVPDEASTGEMISGLPLSGQPGEAVGRSREADFETRPRHGWTNGLLSFALHCRTCNLESHWTIL